MTVSCLFLLSLTLVPQPVELVETSGVCTNGAVVSVTDASLPAEGYRLEVTPSGIAVASSDAAGAFYARQTLRQLAVVRGTATNWPCCRISDRPAYPWRGVLIDEGRHFQGKETVKRTIELMSQHKLNVLHWHLTEDQGWRIDVPGLPELVRYGSVRPESPSHRARLKSLGKFRYASTAKNGEPYGPFFYTRADLEEIVAYAAARHVRIVPEIEVPGHSMGVLAAYPELSCFPESVKPRAALDDWGITTNVCCVGNDKTLRFFEKVLDYVCEVFPSEVIHLGGDECPRVNWERCPKCRARMKAEGLARAGDLQGWITRKMADYLAKKGRRVMGWDEILAGDVPKTAIGQSWRTQATNGAGTELVSAAAGAAKGFDMVVTPHTECYYAYGAQVEDDPFEYSNDILPLSRAYRFDPMTGVPEGLRRRILGSEACCWGEYCWNRYDLEWKLWPRTCALAEVLWTNPASRDFRAFAARLRRHVRRLRADHVNCQPVGGKSPQISVFAKFIRRIARERNVSKAEAAELLYELGVRGYDCGPDEDDLDELAATCLRPVNFYFFPEWFSAVADARCADCLAKAKRYGVPRVMVVPPDFTGKGDEEAEFVRILGCMRAFAADAKAAGVRVTVEDYGGTRNCCSHAKYLRRFLAEIPELSLALDSGNLYYAGRGESIVNLMASAAGRIGHVHLKDQSAEDNRAYVTLGLGAVPNEELVRAVDAAGYDGWYTLENPVGDTYLDTVRQTAVLKDWLVR